MSINELLELRRRAYELNHGIFQLIIDLKASPRAEGYARGADLLMGYVVATLDVEIAEQERATAQVTEPSIDEICWRA